MTDKKQTNKLLFESLMQAKLPTIKTTRCKSTISIVNNVNGRRLTISKALVEALGVDDVAYAMPSAADSKLVLCKTLPFPKAAKLLLHGKGKKTAYNANFVEVLVKMYNLDYTDCTSRSFDSIEFDELEGVPVAIVNF